MSYHHIINEIYSAPITLHKTMGALYSFRFVADQLKPGFKQDGRNGIWTLACASNCPQTVAGSCYFVFLIRNSFLII